MRESVEIIRAAGAIPAGVVIALDRQERGQHALSAVEEVRVNFGLPVLPILTLTDLQTYLDEMTTAPEVAAAVREYRARYGVAA